MKATRRGKLTSPRDTRNCWLQAGRCGPRRHRLELAHHVVVFQRLAGVFTGAHAALVAVFQHHPVAGPARAWRGGRRHLSVTSFTLTRQAQHRRGGWRCCSSRQLRPAAPVLPVHQHLRRVDVAAAGLLRQCVLALRVLGPRKTVGPAQAVPVGDVEGQGQHIGPALQRGQPAVGRRAGTAAFAGVELHHRGRDSARPGAAAAVGQRRVGRAAGAITRPRPAISSFTLAAASVALSRCRRSTTYAAGQEG